jgi:outer membrane lipoprotein carrier protein
MKRLTGKWKLILLIGLLSMTTARAPEVHADSQLVLGDILKRTEQHYQQLQAFTAYFQQHTTSATASGMTTVAGGKLYYQKPRQMRWEYEKPDPQVFVANQHLAWLYVPADRQASLIEAKTFFSSPLAQAFFDGVSELRKHFEVTLDPKQSTKASAVLKLVPKTEDPTIKTLFLWIGLENYNILTVESLDALGNTNRITLKSEKGVPSLEPKLFQMDFPSSTAIVDSDGRELSKEEVNQLKLKLHL